MGQVLSQAVIGDGFFFKKKPFSSYSSTPLDAENFIQILILEYPLSPIKNENGSYMSK